MAAQGNQGGNKSDQKLSPEMEAMQARLEEMQAKLDEAQGKLAAAEGTRYDPSSKPFLGDHGGIKFRVTVKHNNPQRYHHLPEQEVIEASDETEAKRCFLHKYETKKGSGKPLHQDMRGLRVDVECIDKRKGEIIRLQQKIARLRMKVNSGQNLDPDEIELAKQYEDQVYLI